MTVSVSVTVKSLLAVCFIIILYNSALSQPACTHYASPTGSGSVCTSGTPCTVSTFLNSASLATTPGNVLCLNDGVYGASTGRINVPTTFAGVSGNPIWVRALNEGQVLIDGNGGRPVHTRGSWGVLWGVNVTDGDNINMFIGGSNWVVQRVVSWNTNATNTDHNVSMGGTNNTVEDVAVFGIGEKQIVTGTGNQTTTGNVVRRVFAIFQNAGSSTSPTNTGELGYGQDGVLWENVVMTWDRTGTDGDPEGLFQMFRTDNSKVFGSILYIKAGAVFDPSTLFFAATDGGSAQASGSYDPANDNVITHILSYIDPAHSAFSSKRALRFNYTSPGPAGSNNIVSNSVGVSGLGLSCTAPHFTCSGIQQGVTMADAIGVGKSVWTESNAGPGICKRYVGGVLTSDALWPWPMNQRIIDAMSAAGITSIDVTATMEGLFGTIPAVCRSDAPAVAASTKSKSSIW